MPRVIVEQMIKENPDYWKFQKLDLEEEEDVLGWVEEPERFTYLVKIERIIATKYTTTKVYYRDLRKKDDDYHWAHETQDKEEYKKIKEFFKKEGFYKL